MLMEVAVNGVGDALANNSDAQSKGVKAHFEMDSSGILQLAEVCIGAGPGVSVSVRLCVRVCMHVQ